MRAFTHQNADVECDFTMIFSTRIGAIWCFFFCRLLPLQFLCITCISLSFAVFMACLFPYLIHTLFVVCAILHIVRVFKRLYGMHFIIHIYGCWAALFILLLVDMFCVFFLLIFHTNISYGAKSLPFLCNFCISDKINHLLRLFCGQH